MPIPLRSVGLRATCLLALYVWAMPLALVAQPAPYAGTAAAGPITGSLPTPLASDGGGAVTEPLSPVVARDGGTARVDAGLYPSAVIQPELAPTRQWAERAAAARRDRVAPSDPEPDPVRVELHGPTSVKAGEPITVETVVQGNPDFQFASVDYHLKSEALDQVFSEAGPKETFEGLAAGKYLVEAQLIVGDIERTATLRFEVQPMRATAAPRATRPTPRPQRAGEPAASLPAPPVVTSIMPATVPPAAITPPPVPKPDWPLWLVAVIVAVAAAACIGHRQIRGRWLWQSQTVPATLTLRPLTGSFTSECTGLEVNFRLTLHALQDHGTQQITKLRRE